MMSDETEQEVTVGVVGATRQSLSPKRQRYSGFLYGMDIYNNYEEMKYRIGFVPQQELLRMNDTVVRTLDDAAKLRLPVQITEKKRQEIIDSVSNTLGLGAREGLVGKKSGGMKKRLSIGCSVAHKPKVLLLDEPTAALDLACKENIREYMKSHTENGGIILLSTHDEKELRMCDRLYIIRDGALVETEFTGNVKSLTEKF